MEIVIVGDKLVSMDQKGRVIVPQNFIFEDYEEVAFAQTGEPYFNVYPLIKLQEALDRLEQKKILKEENYREIIEQIRTVYYSIIDTYRLDSQRRMLLPKEIRETIPDRKILLQGVNQHISLIQNQDSYDAFCRRYLPENVGIKKL